MAPRFAAFSLVFSALGSIASLGACGSSGSDDHGSGSGGSGGGPPATGPITSLPVKWNEIDPGGQTTCARGDPYRFWVRPGSVNRVVVDFRGGGACWDQLTCSIAGSLFDDKANPETWMSDESQAPGIYDHANADNPFKDWHHVYVAYCTGDVHWGDKETTYGSVTIKHRGAVNAKAALDWVYTNVPSPEKVFVTGCSAGGYGAALWSAYVKQHYDKATVYQLADSAAGIITDTFFQTSFPAWNATENFPNFIGLDPKTFTKLPQLYVAIGATFPSMFISQYNTAYDETQSSYYHAMGGGDATEWSGKMQAFLDEISSGTPSFRSYLAPDYQHCIINSNNFYSLDVGGTKLTDWVKDVVNDKPVDSVSCKTAGNCGAPKPTP